jgi:tetratricopeptide (TPR) repeat protein
MWLALCLGEYHEHKGDYRRAIENYRTYIARDPYNENVLNKIAYCESMAGGKAVSSGPRGAVGVPR